MKNVHSRMNHRVREQMFSHSPTPNPVHGVADRTRLAEGLLPPGEQESDRCCKLAGTRRHQGTCNLQHGGNVRGIISSPWKPAKRTALTLLRPAEFFRAVNSGDVRLSIIGLGQESGCTWCKECHAKCIPSSPALAQRKHTHFAQTLWD